MQLNLFPGDETAPQYPQLPPYDGLTFLRDDLRTYVGSSGRPVVLIHHYGFDGFSTDCVACGSDADCACSGCESSCAGGYCARSCDDAAACSKKECWWTPEQRLAYWNAIKDFNVIAIFTGHIHLSPGGSSWRVTWNRPAGASGGPTSIRTFVSGAALNNVFLEVMIDNDDMTINRLDSSTDPPSVSDTFTVPISTP